MMFVNVVIAVLSRCCCCCYWVYSFILLPKYFSLIFSSNCLAAAPLQLSASLVNNILISFASRLTGILLSFPLCTRISAHSLHAIRQRCYNNFDGLPFADSVFIFIRLAWLCNHSCYYVAVTGRGATPPRHLNKYIHICNTSARLVTGA